MCAGETDATGLICVCCFHQWAWTESKKIAHLSLFLPFGILFFKKRKKPEYWKQNFVLGNRARKKVEGRRQRKKSSGKIGVRESGRWHSRQGQSSCWTEPYIYIYTYSYMYINRICTPTYYYYKCYTCYYRYYKYKICIYTSIFYFKMIYGSWVRPEEFLLFSISGCASSVPLTCLQSPYLLLKSTSHLLSLVLLLCKDANS